MNKSRVYHYDTTYEQEAEDGTVTASVELRIYYTVIPESGDQQPWYPAQAEFHSAGVEIGSTRQFRDLSPGKGPNEDETLYWWAQDFVDDHQDALLIAASENDEADADYAREMRDEMRAEMRRDER